MTTTTERIRTTNAAESFHSHLNANFNSKNPKIFLFTDVIKREQAFTVVKLKNVSKVASGADEVKKSERRMALYDRYQNGEKTRLEYLMAIAHTCPPVHSM